MRFPTILIAFLLLLLTSGCPGGADQFISSSSGGAASAGAVANIPFKWSSATLAAPLPITISEDFGNTDWNVSHENLANQDPAEQMMGQWDNAEPAFNFFNDTVPEVTNIDGPNLNTYNDGQLGIYKSFNWFSEVSANALAITQFFGIRRNVGLAGEHIEMIHADIIVNYRDFNFTMDASSNTEYDLPTVLLHELGHFLGVEHETNLLVPAVMNPFLSVFDSKRTLENSDKNAILANYSGFASSLSTPSAPIASTLPVSDGRFEGEEIKGILELNSNGVCKHFHNGKLVYKHKSSKHFRKNP